MLTGVELAGVVLAVFPLVISGLEYSVDGFRILEDWIHFRRTFTGFVNDLRRQQILLKQHIEILLRSIIGSEFDLKKMLDHLDCDEWKNPDLTIRLRRKLSGEGEYTTYCNSLTSVEESLQKVVKKLELEPSGFSESSIPKKLNLQKKLKFCLSKRKLEEHVRTIGEQIESLGKLFTNAEVLESARRSQKVKIPLIFEQIKNQASSLHKTICQAWKCDCENSHLFKLLLKRPGAKWHSNQKSSTHMFQVSFPLGKRIWGKAKTASRYDDEWCTTEASMVSMSQPQAKVKRISDSGTSISGESATKTSSGSESVSSDRSTVITIPETIPAIHDLCERLRSCRKTESSLGYLSDGLGTYHIFQVAPKFSFSSTEVYQIVSLEEILNREVTETIGSKSDHVEFPRVTRVSIALILAYSLLQLHSTPWLPDRWSKRDIFFLQDKCGVVIAEHPFLLSGATLVRKSLNTFSPKRPGWGEGPLLSLGILILELWFNETLESRSFWKENFGPDGQETEFTSFNAAVKWQQKTEGDGGRLLASVTERCIYKGLNLLSENQGDKQSAQAVCIAIVKELESILANF